jgi:hypothetical membrane protein
VQQPIRKVLYLAGLVSPFWLAVGLVITGSLYPGYSHINQAMSVLGAVDSPTHFLSPLINNYPLGVLLILFGAGVAQRYPGNLLARASGVLIVLHGLASFVTGYFSCDAGCAPDTPSNSQNLHNLAGLAMAFSLLLASALWIFVARGQGSKGLVWFSLVCTLFALGCLPWMAAAIDVGRGFGLFQRVNYFASLIWVAGLAWALLQEQRAQRV